MFLFGQLHARLFQFFSHFFLFVMSAASSLAALQSSHAAAGRADLAKLFQDLASLYEKKLYHQV
jgi:hypothetical protein